MAEIVLSGLEKRYGTVHAVRHLDLTVADQEFVVLVGPSGCGKSTTLRMVAGLEEISAGTIRIGGKRVDHLPPKDRDIAMVFQNYALYQHMSVYDNLAFGLRNRKVREQTIAAEIARAADILGIAELMRRRPRELSGGQQQRVALGRCIVRHPQVFLFDEPLSNLDAKLRAQMRIEIKRLRERVPTTSLFVTHDQVEAMTLGDRIVVMKDGLVQQVGTPLEIYNAPANRFVAGFMGAPAMNFCAMTLRGAGDMLHAEADGIRLPVPVSRRAALERYRDRPVAVGIRPEHVMLGGGNGFALDGRIEIVEQLGSEMLLDVRVGQALLTVSRVDPESGLLPGAAVRITPVAERAHFFDPESESAIV
jgi:multiple sugar transport system ATP-binding protein